jgi:hypothetical protein
MREADLEAEVEEVEGFTIEGNVSRLLPSVRVVFRSAPDILVELIGESSSLRDVGINKKRQKRRTHLTVVLDRYRG